VSCQEGSLLTLTSSQTTIKTGILFTDNFASAIIRAHMKLFAKLLVLGTAFGILSISAMAQLRIIQTNSGGDNISMIDPTTQKVVGEIKGIPLNHGAAAAPDGKTLYFSSEAEQTLTVVDAKTFAITKKVKLSGRPNNICIGKDGKRVYVAIVSDPGAVDVIDTTTLEKVKSIPTKAACTTCMSHRTESIWLPALLPGKTYRCSTRRPTNWRGRCSIREFGRLHSKPIRMDRRSGCLFSLSEFHGFVVVDFAQHKELSRVTLPRFPSPNAIRAIQWISFAWNRRCTGREDPVGHEPTESKGVRVLFAGREASGRSTDRQESGLDHVHTRQQDGVCIDRRCQRGLRDRYCDPKGTRPNYSGRLSKTGHHRNAALKSEFTDRSFC
jgi:YVTN family beta-propeller protein